MYIGRIIRYKGVFDIIEMAKGIEAKATGNRETLRDQLIAKWQPLTKLGGPIHVGEWGCFNKTPHDACLAWMSDLLALLTEAGGGWAMWNLRGPFGIIDSDRSCRLREFLWTPA